MKNKTLWIIKGSVLALLVLLMVIGTFCDLSISKTIADLEMGKYFSSNHFANFLEGAGELPTFILLGLCVAIFGYGFSCKKENMKLAVLIVTAVLCFAVLSYGLIRSVESFAEIYDFADKISWAGDELCCMLLALAIMAGGVLIGKKLGKERVLRLYYFALAVIIVCAVGFIITQGLKMIASRPRFRAIHLLGDYDLFAPWYKANPFTDVPKSYLLLGVAEEGFSSFPSGHTSWASSLIMIAYLPYFIPNLNKKAKIWLVATPSVFIVVVAFSRILAGAHYLTDVTFSMIFTFILAEIAVWFFNFKHKKAYPEISIVEENE